MYDVETRLGAHERWRAVVVPAMLTVAAWTKGRIGEACVKVPAVLWATLRRPRRGGFVVRQRILHFAASEDAATPDGVRRVASSC